MAGKKYLVTKGAILEVVRCPGEAHSPIVAGQIDHCSICSPFWENYPVCGSCKRKLSPTSKDRLTCHHCRVHYDDAIWRLTDA